MSHLSSRSTQRTSSLWSRNSLLLTLFSLAILDLLSLTGTGAGNAGPTAGFGFIGVAAAPTRSRNLDLDLGERGSDSARLVADWTLSLRRIRSGLVNQDQEVLNEPRPTPEPTSLSQLQIQAFGWGTSSSSDLGALSREVDSKEVGLGLPSPPPGLVKVGTIPQILQSFWTRLRDSIRYHTSDWNFVRSDSDWEMMGKIDSKSGACKGRNELEKNDRGATETITETIMDVRKLLLLMEDMLYQI